MFAINEPDIEALIQGRLDSGRFDSVQEVLRQALKDAPLPDAETKRGYHRPVVSFWKLCRGQPFIVRT